MKTSTKHYPLGSVVFAADHYHIKEKQSPYLAIREAVVRSVNIDRNKDTLALEVTYWLATPNGEDWGDCVLAEYVSDNYNRLLALLKPAWMAGSNNWED